MTIVVTEDRWAGHAVPCVKYTKRDETCPTHNRNQIARAVVAQVNDIIGPDKLAEFDFTVTAEDCTIIQKSGTVSTRIAIPVIKKESESFDSIVDGIKLACIWAFGNRRIATFIDPVTIATDDYINFVLTTAKEELEGMMPEGRMVHYDLELIIKDHALLVRSTVRDCSKGVNFTSVADKQGSSCQIENVVRYMKQYIFDAMVFF